MSFTMSGNIQGTLFMNCWSRQTEIPGNAEFCPCREAEVMAERSAEEQAAAESALGAMPDFVTSFATLSTRARPAKILSIESRWVTGGL